MFCNILTQNSNNCWAISCKMFSKRLLNLDFLFHFLTSALDHGRLHDQLKVWHYSGMQPVEPVRVDWTSWSTGTILWNQQQISWTSELDQMGGRIDDLQKNVAELMSQAGMAEQSCSKWPRMGGVRSTLAPEPVRILLSWRGWTTPHILPWRSLKRTILIKC